MRWKAEDPQAPKDGEVRDRKRFAWGPTRIGDQMVWLEFYGIREVFRQPYNSKKGWWSHYTSYTLDNSY